LAGFPKDVYWLYQSVWTNTPVLHLFPHWNWKAGELIDIWAYYNQADEVELFLNNQSLGIKKKTGDDLHVQWRVPFKAGTLKVVSRLNGKIVMTAEQKTAGKPAKIILSADRKEINADGKDLSFITAKVVDENGVMVPDADNKLVFSVKGAAELVATDGGNPTSLESFQSKEKKAFNGLCLAIIKAQENKGEAILKVSSAGMPDAFITIKIK
jgi:beta-galactosidase